MPVSEPSSVKPVWMVVGEGNVTFGPFDTREEADDFAQSYPGRYVYDDMVSRASVCGPWRP